MRKSEMVFDVAILIRDGVITIEDLDGFSEELKEHVQLLGVHMEDFLVKKNTIAMIYDVEQYCLQDAQKRFIAYYKKIYQLVA